MLKKDFREKCNLRVCLILAWSFNSCVLSNMPKTLGSSSAEWVLMFSVFFFPTFLHFAQAALSYPLPCWAFHVITEWLIRHKLLRWKLSRRGLQMGKCEHFSSQPSSTVILNCMPGVGKCKGQVPCPLQLFGSEHFTCALAAGAAYHSVLILLLFCVGVA